MTTGILEFIQIFFVYSVSILGLGELIARPFTRDRGMAQRLLINLVIGNFYIINLTFVLAFLHLWYRSILFFSLLGVAIGLRVLFDKKRVFSFWSDRYHCLVLLLKGELGKNYAAKQAKAHLCKRWKQAARWIFWTHGVELLLLLLILGINVYYSSYQTLHFVSYAAPDVEVHLSWIQSLIGGELFPSGVYPFGMHCIGGVLCKIFQIPAVRFARMFGIVTTFYIMLVCYLFVRTICRQRYAAALTMMIYAIANIMCGTAYMRYSAMISQEYAMIFLCPMMIFLYQYLRDKRRTDVVLFGACVSLTLAVHFYITAIAFFFCLAIGFVYFWQMWKRKLLFPILLGGVLGIVTALLPLLTGLCLGYELEQSFNYGAAVLLNDPTLYMQETNAAEEMTEEDIELASEETVWIDETYTMEQIVEAGIGFLELYVFRNAAYVLIFIVAIAVILLNGIVRVCLRRVEYEELVYVSLTLYFLILFEQTLASMWGGMVVIEPKRMAIFIAYLMPAMMAIVLDILYRLLPKRTGFSTAWNVSVIVGLLGFTAYTYGNDLEKPLPQIYYFQTTGAMQAACDIIEHYENETWTIVSVVNETSIVKNHGYHYEITDFLKELEPYEDDAEIYIPTEYVFFFIEKMPIQNYGNGFDLTDPILYERALVNKESALEEITVYYESSDSYYKYERMKLMSRMYYWAQVYQFFFPDEITTFYEDKEIVVYRLKQNPYALNNLAIDYKAYEW